MRAHASDHLAVASAAGPSERAVGRERCGQLGEEELEHAGPAVPVWIVASVAGLSEPVVARERYGRPVAPEELEHDGPAVVAL